MVDPWASSDPDYEPGAAKSWELDGKPFEPDSGKSLLEQGIDHKSLLVFRT